MKNNNNKPSFAEASAGERGFIKTIILVIVGLVVLKYALDIDVVGILTTGKFGEWLDKIYNLISTGYQKYAGVVIKAYQFIINFLKNIF